MKPELVLGTAEFGHPMYAPFPDEKEILRILNLAYEVGIKTLDTADTYNTERINPLFSGFLRLHKSRSLDKYTYYHYKPGEVLVENVICASVYEMFQAVNLYSMIVPMNIKQTKFISLSAPRIFARSVFANGELFKLGYTAKDCLGFVKRQYITGVIVGVKSVKELEEILKVY